MPYSRLSERHKGVFTLCHLTVGFHDIACSVLGKSKDFQAILGLGQQGRGSVHPYFVSG